MISNRNKILSRVGEGVLHFGRKPLTICTGLLLIISQYLPAQVINNYGAQVNITSGIYITSKDAENNSGGIILNNGNLYLSGSYSNNATTDGNGIYQLGGNWTNTSIFIPGSSTVIFNGSDNQTITKTGGETFYNLSVQNTGAASLKYLGLASNVSILGTLTMSLGNIDAGSYLLYLVNPLAAALNYASTTGSRVLGKFERGVGEQANYLFPLGTASYYNPANLKVNLLTSSGSILSQFFASDPGSTGLPVIDLSVPADSVVEIYKAFSHGYWRMTPNSFLSSDFNINLDAAGFFPDTVRDVTRIIKRLTTGPGPWTLDGTHKNAIGTVVYRNNLTGDLDAGGTEFALGRERPRITAQPVNDTLCEGKTATFTVTATGANPLTYRWYKNGTLITNGPHYSGNRTATLKILNIALSDADIYYCIVSDRYKNTIQSSSAQLIVMKIPVATITNAIQLNACSNIAFTNMVLGFSKYDPGSRFDWTRNNPTGITSSIPLSGTYYSIGDFISGSFDNSNDVPVTITFTILPVGPGPTTCPGNPVTATITVNPHPRATPINHLPAICDNASTDIELRTATTMTQGVIDYDYTVTKSGSSVTGNTASATNRAEYYHISYLYQNSSDTVQSVSYHIIPKNTASGCLPGDTVVVKVNIHPYPIKAITITHYPPCENGSDAAILVTTNKGAGSYYLNWVGPAGYSFQGWNLNYHAGLRSGMYDIDATDSLGCTTFNADAITIPAGAKIDPIITVAAKLPPSPGYGTSCWYGNDGKISVKEGVTSGVPPFDYKIFHNGTVVVDSVFSNYNIIHNYSNLASGNYVLKITDFNGCKDSIDADIIPPDTIKINFSTTHIVSCKGYNDGSIKASVTGGNGIFSGNYTYKWTTIDGSFSGPDNLDNIINLTAGTYTLTVTDEMFCTIAKSFTLTEPTGMILADSVRSYTPDHAYNISCAGGNTGSIDITVTGGTLPYSYFWTDSASYTATTHNISHLIAGTYVCKITDANGCVLKLPPLSTLPSFGLTEPLPLSITGIESDYSGKNIKCNKDNSGSISITVTGGSGSGYIYNWSTSNGSGIVPGAKDQTALTAGTYTLDVTDAYGCLIHKVYVLTEPQKLLTSPVATDITCTAPLFNNGSIDLTVSGGIFPYTYLWSPGGETTKDISGLTQGNYGVTVIDANGCVKNDSVIINNPLPVLYTKTLSRHNGFNISCNGMSSPDGSINITPTQGAAPYSFTWTYPDLSTRTSQNITGVGAGDYYLEIVDSKYCKATETISLSEPGKLYMMIDTSQSNAGSYSINCAGGKTGSIDITPVHAVGSVGYLWQDGSTSKTRTDIPAGIYKVAITDSNGCSTDSTIKLTEPDSLKLSFSVSEPWCPDKPDGAIGTTVTGGVVGTDYTYKWSPDGSTGNSLANILPGIYRLTVTDLNNCVISKSIDLKPQQESCLVIPNAISPNGDLINDVWNIGYIELYPNVEIMIFNRWGETLWRSARGYPDPWDGTSNGAALPIDSYHYIIDLHNGRKPIVGNVTIVR
jgi:gliding motility-associated-like protein